MIIIAAVLCFANAVETDVGIFNQWIYGNKPVLFGWSGDEETSVLVENFDTDYYQMKWTCAAQLNNRMFVFGGETMGGGESK